MSRRMKDGCGLYWLEQKIDRQRKPRFQQHTIEEDYGPGEKQLPDFRHL